jgi:hypothetical protein
MNACIKTIYKTSEMKSTVSAHMFLLFEFFRMFEDDDLKENVPDNFSGFSGKTKVLST